MTPEIDPALAPAAGKADQFHRNQHQQKHDIERKGDLLPEIERQARHHHGHRHQHAKTQKMITRPWAEAAACCRIKHRGSKGREPE
jgi:hypothetical protein